MERRLIDITMEHFRGDKKRSAEALGISVRTLYNRLHDYQRAPADGF
jgi:DNA-binding NtrC family response regulator